jgi:hypothetical protein
MAERSRKEPESGAITCAGKAYEHHERTEVLDGLAGQPWRPQEWRCLDCGDTGTFEAVFAVLLALQPQLYHLKKQMLDQGALVLLPSDATPGRLGSVFGGYGVYRLGGIKEPMIALPAAQLRHLTGPLVTIGPATIIDTKTGKTVEPLAADLTAFLDWPVYLREEGLTCERPDCPHEDCGRWPVTVAETGHTTLRQTIAGLKIHAEGGDQWAQRLGVDQRDAQETTGG